MRIALSSIDWADFDVKAGSSIREKEASIEDASDEAATGCVAKDELLRTGRRSRRSNDKGDLMRKPRSSQRVATVKARPLHPHAEHAIDTLRRGGRNLSAAIVEAIAEEFPDQEANEVEEDDEGDYKDADEEVECS